MDPGSHGDRDDESWGEEMNSFLLPLWEKVAHFSFSDRRRMRGNIEA